MKILTTLLCIVFTATVSSQTVDSILAEHERQREILLRPLEERYDAELGKLLQKLTAAGKFKESMEVDKLIKERLGVAPTLSGMGTWIWPDNKKLVLSSDGKATFTAWPGEGTWKELDVETVEVTNPEGKPGILKMLPDGKGTYTSGANSKGGVPVTKEK
jgi:hypothetical protein